MGKRPSFTFVDLFAGIGGLRRGFEAIGGRCIFTSEWDKYSQRTYRTNFPDDSHEIAGDIRSAASEDVPRHNVLLAGFPCQPFSLAGVSKKNSLNRPHGFACETQGTLFYEVARILAHHRPEAFLLENVKNLVSHDKGRTFKVIRKVLTEDLGYSISWRVIDARHWVPQHRERIFIAGFREACEFDLDALELPPAADAPRLGSILDRTAPEKYTLSEKLWNYLQDYAEKHRLKGNGFGCSVFGPGDVARTLSARYYKDGSEILIRQDGRTPRRLTPRECARLMGFDSAGQEPMQIVVSDTQAYRQFGNSVVVPVATAVARHMSPYIRAAMSRRAVA